MARSPAYDKYPQHTIEIDSKPVPARIVWEGEVIAETQHALVLREGKYPACLYVPRGDARMEFFERTDHSTHCPFKGDASYYTLARGDQRSENTVWTYEAPFDQVAAIRDHLAFYADRVTIEQGG